MSDNSSSKGLKHLLYLVLILHISELKCEGGKRRSSRKKRDIELHQDCNVKLGRVYSTSHKQCIRTCASSACNLHALHAFSPQMAKTQSGWQSRGHSGQEINLTVSLFFMHVRLLPNRHPVA